MKDIKHEMKNVILLVLSIWRTEKVKMSNHVRQFVKFMISRTSRTHVRDLPRPAEKCYC